MSQLTKEEKEYLEQVDTLDSVYYELSEGEHIVKHKAIIDRLSAKCEELEKKNKERLLVIGAFRYGKTTLMDNALLKANLSTLLGAVEPILKALEDLQFVGVSLEMKTCGGEIVDKSSILSDLITLSTVAAGIRGGKG